MSNAPTDSVERLRALVAASDLYPLAPDGFVVSINAVEAREILAALSAVPAGGDSSVGSKLPSPSLAGRDCEPSSEDETAWLLESQLPGAQTCWLGPERLSRRGHKHTYTNDPNSAYRFKSKGEAERFRDGAFNIMDGVRHDLIATEHMWPAVQPEDGSRHPVATDGEGEPKANPTELNPLPLAGREEIEAVALKALALGWTEVEIADAVLALTPGQSA